jgi:hypothetical protein
MKVLALNSKKTHEHNPDCPGRLIPTPDYNHWMCLDCGSYLIQEWVEVDRTNPLTKTHPVATKYRNKSVFEAFQMTEERRWDSSKWPDWLNQAWNKDHHDGGIGAVWPNPSEPIAPGHQSAAELICGTPEGIRRIALGDYIIQDPEGKIYPVKEDFFLQNCEPVEKDADARSHRE